ncbi:MAG: methyltransferase domain-containing protein [Candidatus Tritonobacter lacicola]|nr:methyltransferase domain-containing protein [Candidatus Tritonobacter lacicola]
MTAMKSWSTHYGKRKEIRKRYPSIWRVPLAKQRLELVLREARDGASVLDAGASNRELGDKIREVYPSVIYKTMDIDRAAEHDYYSLDEIDEKFDLIVFSEVIEHLSVEEGTDALKKLRGLLKDGGRLLVTTPNLFHPHRYWDADHRTPYRYDDLAALLVGCGYSVESIYRLYNDPFVWRLLRIHLGALLHRYLDIDFARQIAVVASRG